jgi:hypothetical protein
MRFLAWLFVISVLVGWWDAASAFTTSSVIPPLSALKYRCYRHSLPSWPHAPSTKILFASPPDFSNNSTNLTTKSTNNNDTTVPSSDYFGVEVPIVVTDLLAIAVAMQLLGLTNVLNDPTFWSRGGWLQPVTSTGISNTLPVVVQRFCIVGISWLSAAFGGKGLALESTSQEALGSLVKLLVPFFLVLLLLEGITTIATTASAGGGLQLTEEFVLQTFQLWYFSGIALVAGRYIVSRLPFYY